MSGNHIVQFFNEHQLKLKENILTHEEEVTPQMEEFFGRKPKFIVFLSVSNGKERARVFSGIGNTIHTAWQNAMNLTRRFLRKQAWDNLWIKADLVREIHTYSKAEFIRLATKTRKNYLREGIAFDSHFNLSFLEEEVNMNVFIRKESSKSRASLDEKNLNHYLKTYKEVNYTIDLRTMDTIYTFQTISYFSDGQADYKLLSGPLQNGRREIPQLTSADVYKLIDEASMFLANQVEDNGKFIYGYFPAFDKKIQWYNMLRHASTVYSMVEAYSLTKNENLGKQIKLALQYLAKEGIVQVERGGKSLAFVVDHQNEQEIKLGANAAAILALSKYTSVFRDEQYMDLMRALARGIESMQNEETGGFVHVLNYPSLDVKEAFRIVYYDGEAVFSLLRLYEIDRNPIWLQIVERAFDYFIEQDHWKHHDHWLSYSTNELVKYKPLEKYFAFGVKNVAPKLDFIKNRDTTYPTFLELLMASYIMVERMKEHGFLHLLEKIDEQQLTEVIHVRAHHQLNGFFFPEVAMYFKAPHVILGSFFIRHHSFRSRIDDVEHNISGYYQYYNEIVTKKVELAMS